MNWIPFVFVLGLNLWAFVLFGLDKRYAVHGKRRIPERTLLLACCCAGAIGAWLGVRVFRHKTRKLSFLWKLWAATLLNGLWCWLAIRYWLAADAS